jgi:hypothetical protein
VEGTGNKYTQVVNSLVKKGMYDLKFVPYGYMQKFYDPLSWK